MNSRAKIYCLLLLAAAALCAALPYRKSADQGIALREALPAKSPAELVYRQVPLQVNGSEASPAKELYETPPPAEAANARPAPAVERLTAVAVTQGEIPPELPEKFEPLLPPLESMFGPRWAVTVPSAAGAAEEEPHAVVRHRVRDGDTLASLARRYFGSEAASSRIFAANRQKISRPELLPIGEELIIPLGETPPAPLGSTAADPLWHPLPPE